MEEHKNRQMDKKITAGVDRGGKKRTEIDETGLVIMLELK